MIIAGTNYFTNPSVEASIADFSGTRCAISVSSAVPYVGDNALLIEPSTAGMSAIVTVAGLAEFALHVEAITTPDAIGVAAGATIVAQSFTLPSAAIINAVWFHVRTNLFPTDSLRAKIWSDTGANLPNVVLATSDDLNNADIGGILGWKRFSFSTPISLSSGVKRWVSLERTGAAHASNYYVYSRSASSVYASHGRSTFTGSWSAESSTMDVGARIYGVSAGSGDVIAVNVGDEVNVSGRIMARQANGQGRVNVAFYDDSTGEDQVGATEYGAWVSLVQNEYTEVSQSAIIVPATVTHISIRFEVETTTGTLTSDDFYLDAIVLRRNQQLDTYIDGDQGDGYSWLGTAHASVSTRAADAGIVYRRDYEAPQVVVSWAAWQCDMEGVREREITESLISGFVETKGDRLIPTQGQIKLTDARLVRPLIDYVELEMTVAIPPTMESTTYKMGLFQASIPSLTVFWERPEGTFTLRDRTVELAEAILTDTVTYAVGANAVTSAAALAVANGMACNFPTVSTTLPIAMSFSVGDQVMESINKLLEAANCYPAWMDFEHNVLVTLPIRDLNTLTPWQTLTPDMLLAEPEMKPVNVQIPNVVLVIKENSEEAPIVGEARNDNPASPISTYTRGREIGHVVKDSTVATVAEANTLAARVLQEMSALETALDLLLIPNKPPTVHDSLTLNYHNNDYCLCGRYWISGYRYEILGNSAMKAEINRTREITHT